MDFLIHLAKGQPGKPNVSRVVKDMISKARDNAYALPLGADVQKKLDAMALTLRRSPEIIVAEALEAVESLSENDEPPLLVMELKLVKSHRNRSKNSARAKK